MKNVTKKAILATVREYYEDLVQLLEENRFHPSVPEAGTTPQDHALDEGLHKLVDLIEEVCATWDGEIKRGDLTRKQPLDSIMKEINEASPKNIAGEFDDLKEVDNFTTRHTGENKCEYYSTVYKHCMADAHIEVKEQRVFNGHDDWDVVFVNCTRVEKKEIVTYEWS